MDLFLKGAFLGIVLTSMIGPIMAVLVETSIERGKAHGLWVGGGIWTSDFLFITVCMIAIQPLAELVTPDVEHNLRLAAGMFFIGFGLWMILKRKAAPDFSHIATPKALASAYIKGFLVNTLNPFTFLFWFGTSISLLLPPEPGAKPFLYFFGVMLVVIPGDVAKVWLAAKLRRKVRSGRLKVSRWLAGGAFGFFGVWLLLSS